MYGEGDDYFKCPEFGHGDDSCTWPSHNGYEFNPKVSCCLCGGGCRGEDCPDPEAEAKKLYDEAEAAKAAKENEDAERDFKQCDTNEDGFFDLLGSEASNCFSYLCNQNEICTYDDSCDCNEYASVFNM